MKILILVGVCLALREVFLVSRELFVAWYSGGDEELWVSWSAITRAVVAALAALLGSLYLIFLAPGF